MTICSLLQQPSIQMIPTITTVLRAEAQRLEVEIGQLTFTIANSKYRLRLLTLDFPFQGPRKRAESPSPNWTLATYFPSPLLRLIESTRGNLICQINRIDVIFIQKTFVIINWYVSVTEIYHPLWKPPLRRRYIKTKHWNDPGNIYSFGIAK